ncbi:hypothetical protein PKCBPO_00005 [Methylorubrum thiocyanatum]
MSDFEVSAAARPFIENSVALPSAGDFIPHTLNFEGYGWVTWLPDDLTICGDLKLRGTCLVALPSRLRVTGSVELDGLETLTSLGDHTVITGDLELEGCSALRAMPDYLQIHGDLFLAGSGVRLVPLTNRIGGRIYDLVR